MSTNVFEFEKKGESERDDDDDDDDAAVEFPAQQQAAVLPPPDAQSASLYIGNLHPDVNEALLFEIFNSVGPVASIRVCRDSSTRKSLGYAYINYRSVTDAKLALDTHNFHIMKGEACRIMWQQRDTALRKSGIGNIVVKNLGPKIDNKSLFNFFSHYGNILSCKFPTDAKGSSKGYGYIHYDTLDAAKVAISKTDGKQLIQTTIQGGHQQTMQVSMAGQGLSVSHLDRVEWTTIYVSHIPESWGPVRLQDLFAKYGEVNSYRSLIPKREAECLGIFTEGFGLVNFVKHKAAKAACDDFAAKEGEEGALTVCRAKILLPRLLPLRQTKKPPAPSTREEAVLHVAHAAIHDAAAEVYGGFLRDWVVRGDEACDVDVNTTNYDATEKAMTTVLHGFGITFCESVDLTDPNETYCERRVTYTWQKFQIVVDLVDPNKRQDSGQGVDCDAGNLKFSKAGDLQLKVSNFGAFVSLEKSIKHARDKKFVFFYDPEIVGFIKISACKRLRKYLERGWLCKSPVPGHIISELGLPSNLFKPKGKYSLFKPALEVLRHSNPPKGDLPPSTTPSAPKTESLAIKAVETESSSSTPTVAPAASVNTAIAAKASKKEKLTAKKKSAAKAEKMRAALSICDEDIMEYGQVWADVVRQSSPDLKELEAVVSNVKRSGHELQPSLEEECPDTFCSDYYATLECEFEELDPTLFQEAEAVAAQLDLVFHPGPSKKEERVMEKAQLAYSGNYAKLKDLRRASVVCSTIKDVIRFIKAVQDGEMLTICRVKNRFSKSYNANMSGGYRDLQLNIVGEGGFIWELQVHLAAIEKLKTKMRDSADDSGQTGHQRYVAFRTIRERMD